MKIFKKEKEVVKLATKYLTAVQACVEPAEVAVTAHFKGEPNVLEELRPKVSSIESEADHIRRKIADKLFSGAYMPLMRADIYGIFESLDKVPNAAEACCCVFASQKPHIPEEFTESFIQITADSFGIVADLIIAVTEFFNPKGKIASIREHVETVGIKETKVDRQEWDLSVAIFNAPTLDLAQKMHLKRALDRIVHIPDCAEDAAETLSVAAMKSVL